MQTSGSKIGRTTAYRRVEAQIRDHVRVERWPVGGMLPSRQALAREYGVSMGTVERAVANLIREGILRADSRRGTFVASRGGEAGDKVDAPIYRAPVSSDKAEETLGIIASYPTDFLANPDYLFFWIPQIAHALASSFLEKRERTVMFNIYRGRDEAKSAMLLTPLGAALDSLKRQGVTSVAIIDIHDEIPDAELERFIPIAESSKLPIIHISSREIDVPLPHVFVNTSQNGAMAARYLIEQGHASLTFVSPYRTSWAQVRFISAQHVVKCSGLGEGAIEFKCMDNPLSDESLASDRYAACYECGRRLFSGVNIPKAIIAVGDQVAYAIIDAGKELGKFPGQDYSIVGFDDAPDSLTYGLTTFRPPLERMGEEGAKMLKRIAAGETVDYQVGFHSQLIVRSSTRHV